MCLLYFSQIVLFLLCMLLGREEHITEAVLFWNERKLCKLSSQLSLCLARVCG